MRSPHEGAPVRHAHELAEAGALADGEHRFRVEFKPGLAGRLDYRIRVYPATSSRTVRAGLVRWV